MNILKAVYIKAVLILALSLFALPVFAADFTIRDRTDAAPLTATDTFLIQRNATGPYFKIDADDAATYYNTTLDADLLAIAGLTSASGKVPYFTGSGTAALNDSSTAGRTLWNYTDPNADRVIFWDDSASALTGLTLGTNLSITGTTINASSGTAAVLQDKFTPYTTYTSYSSTQIPYDNTIPQITEGNEFITASITPTASGNKIYFEALLHLRSSDTFDGGAIAMFVDSTANALAVTQVQFVGLSSPMPFLVRGEFTTTGTTALTFRVRAGSSNAGKTWYINGDNSTRMYGGVLTSYIRLIERTP